MPLGASAWTYTTSFCVEENKSSASYFSTFLELKIWSGQLLSAAQRIEELLGSSRISLRVTICRRSAGLQGWNRLRGCYDDEELACSRGSGWRRTPRRCWMRYQGVVCASFLGNSWLGSQPSVETRLGSWWLCRLGHAVNRERAPLAGCSHSTYGTGADLGHVRSTQGRGTLVHYALGLKTRRYTYLLLFRMTTLHVQLTYSVDVPMCEKVQSSGK